MIEQLDKFHFVPSVNDKQYHDAIIDVSNKVNEIVAVVNTLMHHLGVDVDTAVTRDENGNLVQ